MKYFGAVCALYRVSRYTVLPAHHPAPSVVRSGPIPRPSGRSDLTHCDFFLSGWKKNIVQAKWLYYSLERRVV